jgi:hypothetical protein
MKLLYFTIAELLIFLLVCAAVFRECLSDEFKSFITRSGERLEDLFIILGVASLFVMDYC